MEKENVEKEQNKAYLAWIRALTIERSAVRAWLLLSNYSNYVVIVNMIGAIIWP